MSTPSPLIPELGWTPAMVEVVSTDSLGQAGRWTLPTKHLSPSSLGMLHRCPFQFWRRYILGEKERPGEALVVGSAVHAGLERNFAQKIESHVDLPADELHDWFVDEGWTTTVTEQEQRSEMAVEWDVNADDARKRAVNMILAYHRSVATRIQPLSVEGWVEADFGIPVPVIGRFDVETSYRLIDEKTGKALTTKLKPEWRMQAACYDVTTGKSVEFHSIASSKTGKVSIATPITHPDLDAKLSPSQKDNVATMIRGLAALAQHYYDTYGEDTPWPTTGWMHPWACSYCGWRPICPAWGEL